MALSAELLHFLQTQLSAVVGSAAQISKVTAVSGGSINRAYCLHSNIGKYMLKVNSKMAYPNMFACEARGLKAIGGTNAIAVPEVIFQGDLDNKSFLVLEWIENRKPTAKASELLGRQLADMHRNTAGYFGFESDNYMGSIPQSNRNHQSWVGFFVAERLQPMVKIAVDKKLLTSFDIQHFEKFYLKLNDLFDEEIPALIHGDLWGGNYLISTDEVPYLIDPAVSYGNREFDLAMTTLFGGFSDAFYDAYQESYPLNKDWQKRIDLWNLYPLLLHLNLFGLGYLGQVRDGVKRFI